MGQSMTYLLLIDIWVVGYNVETSAPSEAVVYCKRKQHFLTQCHPATGV